MTLHNATKLLLLCVLGLPLTQAVLVWVKGLLTAMGDKPAATVVSHIVTIAGTFWLITLVGLVVALAIQSLDGSGAGGTSSEATSHDEIEPLAADNPPQEHA